MNSTSSLPRVVKNECVDKFWQAVEAFVHPVEDEDIIFLKNEIQKVSEEESEYFNIPQLGQHYKDVWPEEDLLGEMEDGMQGFTLSNVANVFSVCLPHRGHHG